MGSGQSAASIDTRCDLATRTRHRACAYRAPVNGKRARKLFILLRSAASTLAARCSRSRATRNAASLRAWKGLGGAVRDVLTVDPYMDERTLTDFAPLT